LTIHPELNITSIITAARDVKLAYPCGSVKDYLFIAAEDKESYSISAHFDEVYDFIERVRSHGNVLIHCILGVSRSASLALAYLIRKYSYSLDQALTQVRRKRPIVFLHSYRSTPIPVS
jgi:protein-tyrosine phosphatase